MFDRFEMAPADPILGLTEAFGRDERADKINLGVGVYKDENGKTPTLRCVHEAERRLLDEDAPKTYLPITGAPRFGELVRPLLFGDAGGIVADGRAVSAQTPGGTGALRVAADLLHRHSPGARIWVSDPTWANHLKVFAAAGVETKSYRYYDASSHGLDAKGMLLSLEEGAQEGDVVLLHGCCHNPSGVDPRADDWAALAELCGERKLVPLVDLAYQGFGDGIDEDVAGLRTLAAKVPEMFVCSSFSKNFGLYNERIGGLHLVAADADAAARAFSQLKIAIRTNYSNPPRHGGAVVQTVLGDEALRKSWEEELATMRARIREMREAMVTGLKDAGASRDFSFLLEQKGMFSFSGLSPEQVDTLRDKHGVYAVRSGRINVAGITPSNLPRLCEAIADVIA
jgi:aspartate aminotransferase